MSRLAALFLVLLTACAAPAASTTPRGGATTEKRAEKQAATVAILSMPPSGTPEGSTVWPWIFINQFDSITTLDEKLEPRPWAAEKWELRPDGMTWRYTFRKDLTFSNGDPVTIEDVQYSFQNLVANRLAPFSNFAAVSSYDIVDDRTLDLTAKSLDATIPVNTGYVYILPKKYHQQVGREAFAVKPIGSGPYDLAEFKAGDTHVYRLRPNYRHPFRETNLAEIRVRAVPEFSAMVAGLRTGDIDAIRGNFIVDQVSQIKRDGIALIVWQANVVALAMDKTANETRRTPLLDKRVRQAMNYALNRDEINKQLYGGDGLPTGQIASPNTPMWIDDVKPWPYDVAKAKQLLTEAGYPNGFKVPGGIDFSPAFVAQPVILAIQDYLKKATIDVEVNSFEGVAYGDRVAGRNGQTRNELIPLSFSDSNGLFGLGRGFFYCVGKSPEAIITCVPEFDRLTTAAYAEPDFAKRKALLQQANRVMIDEIPMLLVIVQPTYVAHSTKLKGMPPVQSIFHTFDSVYRID